jgi:hypothetical protein
MEECSMTIVRKWYYVYSGGTEMYSGGDGRYADDLATQLREEEPETVEVIVRVVYKRVEIALVAPSL